jgi:membrane-associated phospholipid phosphatase
MWLPAQRHLSIERAWWARVGLITAAFTALALTAVFSERTLLRIDVPLQEWVADVREDWLTGLMWTVTFLGTRYFIGAAIIALTIWTLVTGRCRVALVILLLAFAFNPVLEWALKAGIDRVRPDLLAIGPGRGPSFPSGHVVASVGFYGLLPTFVSETGASTRVKTIAAFASVVIILAIAFSRIYIGVHWFSDVIGGLLIGSVLVFVTYKAFAGHRLGRCPVEPCSDQVPRVPPSSRVR